MWHASGILGLYMHEVCRHVCSIICLLLKRKDDLIDIKLCPWIALQESRPISSQKSLNPSSSSSSSSSSNSRSPASIAKYFLFTTNYLLLTLTILHVT